MPAKPDSLNIHIGKRLKASRLKRGLGQRQVAEAIGITFQQIQKYENGSNEIPAKRLYFLSQVVNEPISYFFEDFDSLKHEKNKGFASERETLELVKAFNQIKQPQLRQKLADIVRLFITK